MVTICTVQWSLYAPYSGHYMYRQFNIQQFYVLTTQLYLCVLCGSENKQRLFPYTAITDWVLGAFTKLGKTTISFGMSVRLSVPNNSTPGGRIFIQFYISILFENPFRKSKSHYNLTTITGTSHADRHTFLIISRLIRLIMTNISDKFVEKIKTHILCSVTFS